MVNKTPFYTGNILWDSEPVLLDTYKYISYDLYNA